MIDSLSKLLQIMQSHGASRFYAKRLAPNDNSKNQVYLGGDFSALNIIPYKSIYTDGSDLAGSVRDRAKADVSFFWVDEAGKYPAPDAQLILYPKYPEVRMSGFLQGCAKAPSNIMRVRDPGRILFLAITNDGDVLGYAATAEDAVTKELNSRDDWEMSGVFLEIPPNVNAQLDTKTQLISALRRVYEKHWIPSQKLRSDGTIEFYSARNGGGYKLSDYENLVYLIGQRELRQTSDGHPRGLILSVHRDSTFKDIKYLSAQLFNFSAHSWRSYFPNPMPVTITYSDLIAHNLGWLNKTPGWNDTVMHSKIGQTQWFL